MVRSVRAEIGMSQGAWRFHRIDRQGRVSLPSELREKLGLKAGDYVQFEEKPGGILVSRPKIPKEARP